MKGSVSVNIKDILLWGEGIAMVGELIKEHSGHRTSYEVHDLRNLNRLFEREFQKSRGPINLKHSIQGARRDTPFENNSVDVSIV